MNKKSIDKCISAVEEMTQKLVEVKRNLEYSRSISLSDYSSPVDRDQARESLEYNEGEIIMALLEINEMSESLVKRIDPEAWDEL